MGKNPLFSTYRQGENRVTSSMLAVFERIDLSLLETILAAAAGESSLQMVTFTNQPPGKGRSVPDARISARFAYWFEVKTTLNALETQQLTEHLANLGEEAGTERLFVVTPDAEQPDAIAAVNDPRVVWFNFRSLHDAIDAAVSDPTGIVAEQGRFLLRELQALLVEDGLVDSDDVVVVAARFAYPEYLRRGAYVCQPERAFRGALTHLGFYANSAIQPHVPRIRYREDLVVFTDEEAAARRGGSDNDRLVGEVIVALLDDGTREEGKQYQVFLLSGPEGPDTVRLAQPIANDTVTESGRPWAWTMHQRYASLANLTRPGVAVTSDLGPRGPRP
jgi:hypothetical protein